LKGLDFRPDPFWFGIERDRSYVTCYSVFKERSVQQRRLLFLVAMRLRFRFSISPPFLAERGGIMNGLDFRVKNFLSKFFYPNFRRSSFDRRR